MQSCLKLPRQCIRLCRRGIRLEICLSQNKASKSAPHLEKLGRPLDEMHGHCQSGEKIGIALTDSSALLQETATSSWGSSLRGTSLGYSARGFSEATASSCSTNVAVPLMHSPCAMSNLCIMRPAYCTEQPLFMAQ